MNRFIIILMAIVFVAAGIAGTYAYYVYVPEKIEKTVISGFNRFGFESPAFSELRREKGQIILKNVALDTERFSTIEELRIHFSLLQFLINPTRAQNVTVHGLSLTGELSDKFSPIIAGWTNDAQIVQSLQSFPADKITIESATLDLLSDHFGGIKINGDGQILIKSNGQVDIKANAATKQNKLGIVSKLDFSINGDNNISFEASFEDFLVELTDVSAKRGNGKLSGTYFYNRESPDFSLSGDFQFASLLWLDMPLSNVKTNINFTPSEKKYILKGSTFGNEQIDWQGEIIHTASANNKKELYRSQINIFPKKLNDIQNFFGRNKKLGVNAYIPKTLLDIASPSINIENFYDPQSQDIRGTLNIKYKKPAALIKVAYKNDPQKATDLVGNIEMDKTTFRPTPEAKDGTRFDLSALGNFTLRDYATKPAFLWVAHTTVHNGILDFGSLEIPQVQGIVFLGGSEAQQKKRKHTLNFSFPLKDNIEHTGTLFINVNNIKKPLLEHLNLKIYGGEIKTQEPITKDGEIIKSNSLDVSNINLAQLTRDAQLSGIFVSGKLAGRIPYETKDGGINVTGGLLQSQDKGIIRISRTITEGLFPGHTVENEILRKALENYHYEFFEIRLDGDLSDRVMMTLSARGENPAMKRKDPVDVNLQIETPISLLFEALMLPEKI